jgi:hypothetical protein
MGVTVLILLFCVGTPLARSALINMALKEDTRETAAAWIDEHLEEDALICVDHKHYAARPSPDKFNVLYRSPLSLGALRRWKVDYVVVGSFSYERFSYGKRNHERAERALQYYRNLSIYGELVKEFSPPLGWQTYGFHNPVVRIYDVRGLSPDR